MSSPPQTIGPFEVIRSLGSGGMGEVLLAYDPRLDRQVAIKRIRPDIPFDAKRRARFHREAKLAARLSHQAIVQVFDLLTVDDVEHLIMEYMSGTSLSRLLKRKGPPPLAEGLTVAQAVADGIAYAHRQGVLHRDLKTENVLFSSEGQAKIADFGLACLVRREEDPSHESLTKEGTLFGTFRAMSPEHILGDQVDVRSDLFSLGVLLYETFTGESPFLAGDAMATIARVLQHPQPTARELAPELPPELSALIDHLLEKEPDLRPRDAAEVADRLRPLAEGWRSDAETTVWPDSVPAVGADLGPTSTAGSSTEGSTATATKEIAPRTPSVTRHTAERRRVTVMCCDLVSVAEQSGTSDPETLCEVMPEFQALAGETIERFKGHLGNVLGHRLLVYFGYPRAHENDAQRAVLAALELVKQCARLQAGPSSERPGELAVRVGIHTGPAVVMPGPARKEQLALGQSLDLATGIQGLAAPNSVVVSDVTYRLIEGFFTVEPPRSARLQGFGPLEVRRVVAATDVHSRMEIADALTPLVAREQELELLLNRWQLTREGTGQVVLLSGEAGIGKSRLLRELQERLAPEAPSWLIGYGSPYTRNSPLHPIIELLRQILKLNPDDPPGRQFAGLEERLLEYGLPADAVPLIARLLSLPLEERDSAPRLSPEQRRKKTLEALLTLLLLTAERRATALVIEDLQWVDPSTLELFDLLVDQGVAASLFVLLTFRPEFEAPWGHRSSLTELNLKRLTNRDSALLIDQVMGERALPSVVREQIVVRTDGVPFFIEELTKEVLESGRLADARYELTGSLPPLAIPDTLQDSLMARLDRLGTSKEVAEMAAVCGREFPLELLAEVSPLDESVLRSHLDRLVRAELLRQRGIAPRIRYHFRHALIQETASNSLLQRTREDFHHRIASALEAKFPQTADAQPELLGHHWEMAGLSEQAIPYLTKAADRSRAAFANPEAIAFYQRVIALVEENLQRQPYHSDWLDYSIRLHEGLGDVMALTGRGEEARDAYRATLELGCPPIVEARIHRKSGATRGTERRKPEALQSFALAEAALGPRPEPAPGEWWEEWIQIQLEKMTVHYFQAELAEITALVEVVEPLLPQHGTSAQRAEFFSGGLEFNLRRERYRLSDQTLDYARAGLTASEEVGESQRIADSKFNLGFVLLCRNQLDEALELMKAALGQARRIGAVVIEAVCLPYLTLLHRKRGEVDETRRSSSEIVAGTGPAQQKEYIGLVYGNLAWAAWRAGSLTEVEEHAARALECWQEAMMSYPFQWTALLPLLAAKLDQDELPEAIELARRLLEPSQEQLASPLPAALDECIALWEDRSDETRGRLAEAVQLARKLLYL
ncbi:MAG: protein kinase [bacterium]|nr:protein kinase [bacterium]